MHATIETSGLYILRCTSTYVGSIPFLVDSFCSGFERVGMKSEETTDQMLFKVSLNVLHAGTAASECFASRIFDKLPSRLDTRPENKMT